MPSSNLHVLITRPEKQGRVLVQKLRDMGLSAIGQPMFDYQPNINLVAVNEQLSQMKKPLLIFVSVAAVDYANKIKELDTWHFDSVYSVGKATQNALKTLGIDSICPARHDSEGLLTLPALNDVEHQDILIIRGDGGRELIAQRLEQRGANVHYMESYRRVWRALTDSTLVQWHSAKINCIVVTSNALLENIVHYINNDDIFWQNTCLWVVASERIAQRAKQLGLQKVINANGANDDAITAALIKHGTGS